MTGNIGSVIAGGAFVKIALDNAEMVKGLKESQSKMKQFIAATNSWGTNVAFTAAMLHAPFLKALDVFSEFDMKMRQLKAVTNATSSELKDLTDQARTLGRVTSFTTAEVANAMVVLGRLGFSVREVKDATRPVMNLARATGCELADAAMVAGNNMRVFGIESSKLEGITDIIVTTVNGSAQSLQDFAEASAKAGPNFKNTGSDIKEMAASLGVLSNMGIRGSIAGTALSRSIKRLATPKVIEMLKGYRIEVETVDKRMKPLHENLRQIAKVMNTLSHAERIHLAEEIFEVRGSLAGLPLATNVEAIDEFIQKLDNASGAGSRFAKEMEKGVWGSLKLLASAFNDLYISIGQMFSFSFKTWIDAITSAINKLNKGNGYLKEGFRIFLELGTVLSVLGGIVKLTQMWGSAILTLLSPILKLQHMFDIVSGKLDAEAAKLRKNELEKAAIAAREIALEKEKTAVKEQETAKRMAADLKEAKAREMAVVSQLNEGRKKESGATASILKAKSDYTRDFGDAEAALLRRKEELKVIEDTNSVLKKKVASERQSLENANLELARRDRIVQRASREYNEISIMSMKKNVDINSLDDEKSKREDALQQAAIEKTLAANRQANALDRHKNALNELSDNSALLAQKREEIALETERIAVAKKSRDTIIAEQEQTRASISASNAELKNRIRLMHSETASAEKAANASRKIAEATTAEATRFRTKADEATTTAKNIGADPNEKARLDAAKALEDKIAAERIVKEKEVTLAKATEMKRQAELKVELAKSEMASFQQEAAIDDEYTRKSIANANARANAQYDAANRTNITGNYNRIKQTNELDMLRSQLESVQSQKSQYVSSASAGQLKQIAQGRDAIVKSYNAEIASLQSMIAIREQNIAIIDAERTKTIESANAAITKEQELIATLNSKAEANARVNVVGQKKVSNSGWEAYLAAEKEIDAKMQLEKANSDLANKTSVLNDAQRKAKTITSEYTKLLINHGHGSFFASAASAKTAKQILKTSVAEVYATAVTKTGSKTKAFWYGVEAAAAKGAAVVTLALKSALDALAANPITVAFMAIVGAITLMNRAISNAAEKANALSDGLRNNADDAAKEVSNLKRVHEAEQDEIKFLVDLEKQGKSTSEQQEVASTIVENLSKKYNGLNIVIDKMTGKITGAYEAQRLLNREQRNAMFQKLDNQLNLEERNAESLGKGLRANFTNIAGITGGSLSYDQVSDEQADLLKKLGYEFHEAEYDEQGFVKKLPQWINPLDNIDQRTDEEIESIKTKFEQAKFTANEKGMNKEVEFIQKVIEGLEKVLDVRKQIAGIKDISGAKKDLKRQQIEEPIDEKEIKRVQESLQKMDEKNSLRNVNDEEKKLHSLKKENEEYAKSIDLLKKAAEISKNEQLSRQKDAREEIASRTMKIRELEKRNVNGEHNKEIAELSSSLAKLNSVIDDAASEMDKSDKEIQTLEQKKIDAEKLYLEEMEKVSERAKARAEKEEGDMRKSVNRWFDLFGNMHKGTMFEERDRNRLTQNQDKKISNYMNGQNGVEKDYNKAISYIQSLIKSNKSAFIKLKEQYNMVVDLASANGYFNGTMSSEEKAKYNDEIRYIDALLKSNMQRQESLRQKMESVKEAKNNYSDNTSSLGSFSAQALSRALAPDNVQKRALTIAEKNYELVTKLGGNVVYILNNLQSINKRFGTAL